MSWIESLVETPLAAALGWALLHFVWQGAAVALLLAVMLSVLRSSRARYAATCAALFSMPLMFAMTTWISLPAARELALVAAQSWFGGPLAAPVLAVTLPEPSVWQRFAATLPWLAPYWLAGVFLLWARAGLGLLAAQRLRRTGVCAVPPEWQTRFDQMCQSLRISRPVLLMESCLAEAPVVVGFFRPVVLLPLGLLTGFPAEQVQAFLIHELAHIGRADYLVNLAQTLVEGLLFYHPAVWWVSAKIRAERENCCDDRVVEATGDAPGYAAALTMLEEKRWLASDAALAANGGSLMKRIRRLLGHDRPRAASAPLLALLVIPACLAAALYAQVQSQPQPPSPYQLWLQEDVAYIITPQERSVFLSLQTDQQRQDFIAQFWLRRDPTPGTPRNEFQEEHYRRIDFANRHFADGNLAGWKTDLGRIYIMFGPPDERDIHAHGGLDSQNRTLAFPFEEWRYRVIQGIGADVTMEFVDRDGTGRYRMTVDPAAPNLGQRFIPTQPQ